MHWQCDGFLGWLDTLDFNCLRRKLARRQRSPKQQAIETFQLRRKKEQGSKDARKMPDIINTPGFLMYLDPLETMLIDFKACVVDSFD